MEHSSISMIKRYWRNTIILIIVTCSPASYAHLDAHVNGLAQVTIAIEDQTIEIEISAPAADLVGFEHVAKTESDIKSVADLATKLAKDADLFVLKAGNCKLVNSTINTSSMTNQNSGVTDKVNKPSHNDGHSEVVAHYRYHCKKIENLSTITVTVFEKFPSIEKIQAMWVTSTQQGAITLNIKNNIISLR
ncbi:DUF2796 domain-containing protein [Shewanella sp. HL-SH4]|uniref:DUF2796 domain-containing protein n=1 Tax=Shewanella sp. HL-SH4 TaxID=3436240 RepID=UPI003EBE16B7